MPSAHRPGLDKRYDDIVVRAMQRQPQNRYGTCAELLTALRRVVTTAPQVRLRTSPSRPVSPRPVLGPVRAAKPVTPAVKALPGGPALSMVQPERPEPKKRKNNTMALAGVASVLILVGGLAGGWMYLTKDEGEEAANI